MGATYLCDVIVGDDFIMSSKRFLEHILVKVPGDLGLTPHNDKIFLEPFNVSNSEEIAYSGIIFLGESHFGIHEWPEKRYVRVELSSCKKINTSKLKKLIKEL